ncbi:Abcb9 [Symbiodinium necroappetens]|uniref:Abcb9 protein n=1 Tax=Symbiodinium necroappetens TaxID=1628268 RepID=A0A813AR46_9DINO|nr:Abcb9 [Symbiodinium necroappetens]
MSWSKAYNNALCMRCGLQTCSPLLLDFGQRWPALDVYSRQLRAFRSSSQPSLRPTLSATAACRSQVLHSTRRIRLQSDASSEHSSNKPTLRRLLALLWPDRVLLGVALCFLIGAAVSQAMLPHCLSDTLRVIIAGQASGTLGVSTFTGPLSNLLLAALAGAFFSSLRGACFIVIGARASVRLRKQLFKSLLKQDLGFYDTTKTGEITSRLTQDCQRVADQVSFNVNFFSRTVVELVATLCFMLSYSAELTMISFATVPVVAFLSKKVGHYMQKLSEATQQRLADANAVAEEALSSIATVRTFGGEAWEEQRFQCNLLKFYELESRRAKVYVGYLFVIMILPHLGNCLVLFQIGRLCVHGLSAPTLLAFVFYLQTLNGCFNSLADIYTNIMQALGSATRVFALVHRKPNITQAAADPGSSAVKVKGHLELRNVYFSYPAHPERQVLKGLSLQCEPGSAVALVGASGGGKSTCISLFQRLYEPQKGAVFLDQRDIMDYDSSSFTEVVSAVNQEPVLFGCSIRENILYGLPEDHPARSNDLSPDVVQAACLANAHRFIQRMADGYDTEVGERGVQLSGGQKQRIAIARALVRKPQVLLLDEATSALDAESELQVQIAINNLVAQQDMTVVIVAHRLSTVQRADKICVVEGGVIVEQGRHADLLQKADGHYKRLVDQQLKHCHILQNVNLRPTKKAGPLCSAPGPGRPTAAREEAPKRQSSVASDRSRRGVGGRSQNEGRGFSATINLGSSRQSHSETGAGGGPLSARRRNGTATLSATTIASKNGSSANGRAASSGTATATRQTRARSQEVTSRRGSTGAEPMVSISQLRRKITLMVSVRIVERMVAAECIHK